MMAGRWGGGGKLCDNAAYARLQPIAVPFVRNPWQIRYI
jgi:hypothetical protein